jgi:hypothetical protein
LEILVSRSIGFGYGELPIEVWPGCPLIGPCLTFSWIFRIASSSISGRGGQPGRYMSTGTMWSTPCTIA